MRIFILIIAILFVSILDLFAQDQETRFLVEEYLRQSEKQKKTAIIMMGAGAGAMALGLLLASSSSDWDSPSLGGGIALFFVGSVSTVVGIPILVSSASKARKAGQLSLDLNTVRVLTPGGPPTIYPGLKLSVSLNSAKRSKIYCS